ncbi:MAG: glycosyltransferase [Pseudomonadota bacterium]
MRLLIIQYGDYYKALKARDAGEPETYRAQYQSLDAVDRIIKGHPCMVICLENTTQQSKKLLIQEKIYKNYQIIYGNFIPSISSHNHFKKNLVYKIIRKMLYRVKALQNMHILKKIVQDFAPSHLIIRTSGWILGDMGMWAIKNQIHLLPLLADYEEQKQGLKKYIGLRHLKVLHSKKVPLLCNHNYPACRSLVYAGVPANKVVPWDWTVIRKPIDNKKHKNYTKDDACIYNLAQKEHIYTVKNKRIELLYAGLLQYNKGVGDILHALAILRHEKNVITEAPFTISLSICGTGPDEKELRTLGESLGLCGLGSGHDIIHFCGVLSNDEIWSRMQSATAVIVPSWHSYPEGMPNVIYEAFEAYTPIIASDHPSFLGRLKHGRGCMIFQAQQARSLARTIWAMGQDAQHERISDGIIDAWQAIQCPVSFEDVLVQWKEYTLYGKDMPCLQHSIANMK